MTSNLQDIGHSSIQGKQWHLRGTNDYSGWILQENYIQGKFVERLKGCGGLAELCRDQLFISGEQMCAQDDKNKGNNRTNEKLRRLRG